MIVYTSKISACSNIEKPDAGLWGVTDANSYTSTTAMAPANTHESQAETVRLEYVSTFSYLGFRLKVKKV